MQSIAQVVVALAGSWSGLGTPGSNDEQNRAAGELPVVDLGYAIHQPSFHNISGQYYNFSNIRYAAPPLGSLRFTAPEPPLYSRDLGIQDGTVGYNCPQSMAAWVFSMDEYGNHINQTGNITYEIPPHGADENEDCLFLDVLVPEAVLSNAGSSRGSKRGASVLVWIYGGAYIMGSKSYWGNPSGLIAHNQRAGREGLIFVSLNYRLGALGWLAGPSVQSNGTVNAGFFDQRMALDWVQKYISLFGGDPERVTVMGESAGGGSILSHITAYGALKPNEKTPFSQAIIQSPGLLPVIGNYEPEVFYREFLDALNVSTLADARKVSSQALIRANDKVVATSTFGKFKFGPTIDGRVLPDLPGKILASGGYEHDLNIMVGHCPNEGHQFTPDIDTDEEFRSFLESFFPVANLEVLNYISGELYPPIYDGTYPYYDMRGRLDLLYSEFVFTCHTNHLARAYSNKTYHYQYNNSLGLHTDDLGPTFMNGNESWAWDEIGNTTAASILQEYITAFAVTRSPNDAGQVKGVPNFPMYGRDSVLMDFGVSDIKVAKDPTANSRCDWWQRGLIY
ncbi:Alpha/Beta hydrolase protein [Xylariales sp. AK1849]|nr:Alpha/Beta hydrolase protein [Xylariales sp. AK1849]